MTEKAYLTFEEVCEAGEKLAAQLMPAAKRGEIKGLVAILNGGVFPAYFVRKILKREGFPCAMKCIDVESYTNYSEQGEIDVREHPNIGDGAGWVFVDEICDTGNTIKTLRDLYPAAKFASLSSKEKGLEQTDYNVLEFRQDQWVVFPWEVAENGKAA